MGTKALHMESVAYVREADGVKIAQHFSAGDTGPKKSLVREADGRSTVRGHLGRPLRGLSIVIRGDPSTKVLGYFHWSASPTVDQLLSKPGPGGDA